MLKKQETHVFSRLVLNLENKASFFVHKSTIKMESRWIDMFDRKHISAL